MFKRTIILFFILVLSISLPSTVYGQQNDWEPAEAPLMSKWVEVVVKFDFEHLREIHEALIEN